MMNTVSKFIRFWFLISMVTRRSLKSEAALMLSPFGFTSVCPERNLTLLCSTNRTFIRWNVTILQTDRRVISRSQLVSSGSQNIAPLTVGTKSFVITANSTNGFTSSLIIANTTNDLNGTTVRCTDIGDSIAESSTSVATIHIVKGTAYQILESDVVFVDVPRDDDVMVILKGTQLDGLSYSIMVHPPARNITRLQESTSFELSLSYNTTYNVSVVPSFCDERGAPTVFNLYFAKCDDLQNLLMLSGSVNVSGSHPAVPGSNATFSCSIGLELIGPNSSMCAENGEWEPDPREVTCRVSCGPPPSPSNGYILHHTSTLDGETAFIVCLDFNLTITCTHDGIWVPNSTEILCGTIDTGKAASNIILILISVLTSFAGVFLASLLIIITGCVCCCFCESKQKQVTSDEHIINLPVIYEEIFPRGQEKDFELNQNIAYGPIGHALK